MITTRAPDGANKNTNAIWSSLPSLPGSIARASSFKCFVHNCSFSCSLARLPTMFFFGGVWNWIIIRFFLEMLVKFLSQALFQRSSQRRIDTKLKAQTMTWPLTHFSECLQLERWEAGSHPGTQFLTTWNPGWTRRLPTWRLGRRSSSRFRREFGRSLEKRRQSRWRLLLLRWRGGVAPPLVSLMLILRRRWERMKLKDKVFPKPILYCKVYI